MSVSGPSSGGYRWVDSPGEAAGTRRRWWVVVVLVVAVLAGAGVWAWRWGPLAGPGAERSAPSSAPPIGTPKDLLLFSLSRQPVAGWRDRTTDLGLPEDAPLGDLFASAGDKAYFLSQFVDLHCGASCRPQAAWVYGVDTRTGAPLFDPVPLPDFQYAVTCYGNGPAVAVCLKNTQPLRAWVIDLDKGKLTYTGSTDVAFSGFPGPEAHPIGTRVGQSRLLATINGQGVYGVGARGERTWFVPGQGFAFPTDAQVADDIPAPTTAVSPGRGADADRVFSVVDGTEFTPKAPEGAVLNRAVVYNGGFAYAYQNPATRASGVMFFDARGKLVEQRPFGTSLVTLIANPAVPMTAVDGNWQIYTADGKQLVQFPAPQIAADVRTIGTKVYVNLGSPGERRWQQFDVLTGQPGPVCTGWQLAGTRPTGTYVGSDGAVLLTETADLSGQFQATDAATCEVLWETPADTKLQMWKVGTGLLQADERGRVMTWLRPPP